MLERYFAAQATDAEEQELRDYFRWTAELPASLRYARTMFVGLDELTEERCPDNFPAAWGSRASAPGRRISSDMTVGDPKLAGRRCAGGEAFAPPAGKRPRTGFGRVFVLWTAAAVLALGIFLCGYLRKPYCYIDGKAVYDREMALRATVYLQPLAALGEPDRMIDELIRND